MAKGFRSAVHPDLPTYTTSKFSFCGLNQGCLVSSQKRQAPLLSDLLMLDGAHSIYCILLISCTTQAERESLASLCACNLWQNYWQYRGTHGSKLWFNPYDCDCNHLHDLPDSSCTFSFGILIPIVLLGLDRWELLNVYSIACLPWQSLLFFQEDNLKKQSSNRRSAASLVEAWKHTHYIILQSLVNAQFANPINQWIRRNRMYSMYLEVHCQAFNCQSQTDLCIHWYDSLLFNQWIFLNGIQETVWFMYAKAFHCSLKIRNLYEANPFFAFILSVTPPLTLEILGRFSLAILETDWAYSAFCWLNLSGLMTTPVLFRMAGLLRFLRNTSKISLPILILCKIS